MTQAVSVSNTTSSSSTRRLIVDALEYPIPERRWFEEWHAGSVSCVHVTVAIWEGMRETVALVDQWRQVAAANYDLIEIATTTAAIEEIAASGRTAVLMGFQNSAPIEHDISLVELFYSLGIRIMQLTYNLQNYIGAGYWEADDSGLSSRFGRAVVQEMNRLGMLIDLSHCGDRTTRETIDFSSRPVAITHANPRDLITGNNFGSGRLKPLDTLKALEERGGVLGMSPNRNMLSRGVDTTREEFCDMVAATAEQIGVEAIGLGSDYCPGHDPSVRTWWRYARWSRETAQAVDIAPHEGWQDWFRGPEDMSSLIEGLTKRGFSDAEVDKMMGRNWLRIFRDTF